MEALKLIAKMEFTSPINIDTGSAGKIIPQGVMKSTMELFQWDDPNYMQCEWVPEREELTQHIGLWFNENKELDDYDGVFDLPKQLIDWLEELGYKVGEDFRFEDDE